MISHVEKELKLKIPIDKRVPLGQDPVPFLGYVLHHDGYRVLSRNRHRYKKKVKRLKQKKARPSYLAQVSESYQAWSELGLNALDFIDCENKVTVSKRV